MSDAPALTFTKNGLYCGAGDFYIDPVRPVKRALITHGHADHARRGHESYLATHSALPVMRHRLGNIQAQGISFSEKVTIGNAQVSFHPAGHIPGSAQIRVEVAGEVWVAAGDYKIEDDGLSEAFEPQTCHHFITESTFGLPVFRWRPQKEIADEINAWWQSCAASRKTAFLGAYALGKAQRLLSLLDTSIGPVLTHGAVETTNEILRQQGFRLPDTTLASADVKPGDYPGALVLAPPSALGSSWATKFGAQETAFASGWMQLRGIQQRRSCDRGFVISDHADWPGLLRAIKLSDSENIYVTHGYTDILMRHLNDAGYNARVVPTDFPENVTVGSDAI